MKTAAFLLLIAGLAGSGANATVPRWNPKAPENAQVFPAFTYANVESVLTSIGARFQRSGSAAKPTLLVTFPNKCKAVVALGACTADGSVCKSLTMQSSWTKIANAPLDRTADAVQRFDRSHSFAKSYLSADGRPGMERYLTADYGFIRGNLAVNLLVFANQVERFAVDVLQPLETRR